MNLTDRQKEAIKDLDHNLLLIAGPGTGKTTVLSKKVAFLLDQGYHPNEILVSTFTNKATDELKNRIALTTEKSPHHLNISTIHKFCRQIIDEFAYLLDPLLSFKYLDENSQKFFILKNINELGIKISHFASEDILYKEIFFLFGFYDSLNEHLIELRDLKNYLSPYSNYERTLNKGFDRGILLKDSEMIELFFRYKKLMWENRYLDLSQTLKMAYTLLNKYPEVRETLQKRYRYILVDEYQDTSILQHEIFKLLKSNENKICVVGDDDQGIYSFRGATIKNMLFFQNDFNNVKIIPITANFRSTQSIVNLSAKIAEIINERIDKPLESKREVGQKVIYINGETPKDSARKICSIIQDLTKNNIRYSEIALLFTSVRWKFIGQGYKKVFDDIGIPCIIHRSGNYFDFPQVRQMTEMLYILIYKDEITFELMEILIRNLGHSEEIIVEFIEKFSTFVPFNQVAKLVNEIDGVSDKLKWQFERFFQLKDKIVNNQYSSLLELIYGLFSILSYPEKLILTNDEKALLQLAYYSGLAESFEEIHSIDIKKFYETLLIFREKRNLEEAASKKEDDAVHVSTIHNVKGLEYKAVFLCDFNPYYKQNATYQIPEGLTKKDQESSDNRFDDQFRLLYTGLTRAKDHLFISHSKANNSGKPLREPDYLSQFHEKGYIEYYHGQAIQADLEERSEKDQSEESINLSFSAFNCYRTCPLKYDLEYNYHFKTTKNEASQFGDIIHKILELVHRSVIHGKEIIEDSIFNSYESLLKKNQFIDYGKWDSTGKNWIKSYLDNDLTKIQDNIIGVEESFEVFIKQHRIIGTVDILLKDQSDAYQIIDIKTGEISESHIDQLLFYSLALELERGIEVNEGWLYYLKQNEKVQCDLDNNKKLKFKDQLNSVLESIESKDFNAKPNLSHCKGCAFYKICGYT